MPPARRTVRAAAALVAALLVLAAAVGCGADPTPDDAAHAYLDAWTRGDDAAAAALTDSTDIAGKALASVRRSLKPAGIAATVDQVRTARSTATASITITWDLGQGRKWSYPSTLDLRPAGNGDPSAGWRVHWAPSAIHPQLVNGQNLALREQQPEQAPVVDRTGAPLLAPTPVVSIVLDRVAAGDLPKVAGALATALGPFDPSITAQSISDGAAKLPDGQGYQVAVLRDTDYQQVKAAIHELPGVHFSTASRLLAPDAAFASQVLPAVRTLVADQVNGSPGYQVVAVDGAGDAVATLTDVAPKPGTTVTLGLDHATQVAAEDAVQPLPQQTVLVAIQPSTGDILAVAQNAPADAAGSIALTGRYPPGSTFKIVTADAALEAGSVTKDTAIACPGSTTIGGRVVPNDNDFDLGTVPLITAFAKSCNTTFAGLAAGLGADALTSAANRFGLGADYSVAGLTTVTGSVPPASDLVERAEDGFGQGKVLASPLGMALVAATVVKGSAVTPELVRGRATTVGKAPGAPAVAALDQLRPMMRQVVLSGTATKLNGLGEVFGKTGTAEFTDNGTTQAHGWFVGYRGDLAFAVLVVGGGSSTPAVGVAASFLRALG